MSDLHPYILHLLNCIDLEDKEQADRFRLDKDHSLKVLKAEGLALHPIRITRKYFGYADYPEVSFFIPYPIETRIFSDGAAIECFAGNEEPIKGILLGMDGKKGEMRLFAPDFPDWIEDKDVGIKLAPDFRTSDKMKSALKNIPKDKRINSLFNRIHSNENFILPQQKINDLQFFNQGLNKSQQDAVKAVLNNAELMILHGPPGTGKTTTLIEAIQQLIVVGEKVLVSAPSNTAIDHITEGLISKNVKVLRIGNTSKASEKVFPHTPEGKLENSKIQKDIKKLKIRAEELRKMALQYKRNFGKDERNQRNLLFKEVKQLRNEIKSLQKYHEESLFEQADVILGTPIGLQNDAIEHLHFETLIIDEAGQCLEPLAWCVFPMAEKIVLAGDHLQLPPTVLSKKAADLGFNKSILEVCIPVCSNIQFLDTQYRMRKSIAGFSSEYFYNNLLQSAEHLTDTGVHIYFYDTAGAGHNEAAGENGTSLVNEGELQIVQKILEAEKLDPSQTAFISPYSGQVALAKDAISGNFRISTIDSFQGQEKENIIVSLVRSNDSGEIGFLNDYRRMNVALTRAKEQLFVIGDSATIGNDPFFAAFLEYVERQNGYRSVWELV